MPALHGSGDWPWRPADAARPLYWWDERGLQALAVALQDLLAQWCAAWGIDCDAALPRCRPAGQQAAVAGRWLVFDAQAWLCLPEDKDAGLLRVLFPGASVIGPMARAVAGSCREDATARVAALLGLARGGECGAPPLAALTQVGSGAAEADLSAPLGARLLLAAHVAARWRKRSCNPMPRQHEPLVAATAALASRPLALELELEGCELEVGALQGLQVGDVVRLDHGLQSPAAVRHAGAALCSAYLGRRGGRKAVELAGPVCTATREVPR